MGLPVPPSSQWVGSVAEMYFTILQFLFFKKRERERESELKIHNHWKRSTCFFIYFLNQFLGRIVALQCSVCQFLLYSKVNQPYVYIYNPLPWLSYLFRSPRSTKWSPLSYTVSSHQLSLVYITSQCTGVSLTVAKHCIHGKCLHCRVTSIFCNFAYPSLVKLLPSFP